jgi:transglycosylase associated protein
MNILLGVIGAAVTDWLFGFFGITFGGWIGYLIAGFIGACILIAIARAFSNEATLRAAQLVSSSEKDKLEEVAKQWSALAQWVEQRHRYS